jgi:molecular chaperone HtpG
VSESARQADEQHEFKAEVNALLRLVTNSLYTNREIFLRELISNASDALDRARFQALVTPELRGKDEKPRISIIVDEAHGVLSVEDNGIGMSRDEAIEDLGTIAHSGTVRFIEAMQAKQAAGQEPDLDLIGQFGVGFYSALIVADRIEVHSLSARPDEDAVKWSSTGDGTFSVGPSDRKTRGTRIDLHLKDDAKEFLERFRVESIVRRYSNYVMHPITFQTAGEDGKPTSDPEQVNEASAFWARRASDLKDEDYEAFYKHVMGGFVLPTDKPLARLHVSLDAPIQFHAVLLVPGRAPADLFMEDRRALQLYAKRILVMEDCDTLLPTYLRFFRGVVDSEDLPLNVSREMLQEHKTVSAIRRQLTRKSLNLLTETAKDDPETYDKIWREFGAVLKEGVHVDTGHRDQLLELLRYPTCGSEGKLRSLAEYVEAMPEDQEAIYYAVGQSPENLAASPHLEACRDRGHATLLMTDPIDEWVVQDLTEYKGKPLRSVTREESDEGEAKKSETEESIDPGELAPAIDKAKEILGERIRDVRPSQRLKDSAACLVDPKDGLSRNMERILRMANQEVPSRPRILELNPSHPFVQAVNELAKSSPEDPRLPTWVELLHDQANLAEGVVHDPPGVVKRLQSVLEAVAAQK